jgi:hypothetical protein
VDKDLCWIISRSVHALRNVSSSMDVSGLSDCIGTKLEADDEPDVVCFGRVRDLSRENFPVAALPYGRPVNSGTVQSF